MGKKKVKRSCGFCGPCLVTEDCGKCASCRNKKKWRKKCELRICQEYDKVQTKSFYKEMAEKKWFFTLQLSNKLIEACYNLEYGQKCHLPDTIYDNTTLSKDEEKVTIDLEDALNMVNYQTTSKSSHTVVDVGFRSDLWCKRNVNVSPNIIKDISIKLERIDSLYPQECVNEKSSTVNEETSENVIVGDGRTDNMSKRPINENSQDDWSENDNEYVLAESDNHFSDSTDIDEQVNKTKKLSKDKNKLTEKKQGKRNVYMIKVKCPICKLQYKYCRLGIIKHLKKVHKNLTNQLDMIEQFKLNIVDWANLGEEKIMCKMCDTEYGNTFYPLHLQWVHSETKQEPCQVALAEYFDSVKSIETLSSEEIMKKFGMSVVTLERSASKSDTIECEHCGKLFGKRRHATHLKKCVKNVKNDDEYMPSDNDKNFYDTTDIDEPVNKTLKLSKKKSKNDDEYMLTDGDNHFDDSTDIDEQVNKTEKLSKDKNKLTKKRQRKQHVYMIKVKCPICKLQYNYCRLGIIRHLKTAHKDLTNQLDMIEKFKLNIIDWANLGEEKIMCQICDTEYGNTFYPLHLQWVHSEKKQKSCQVAFAEYFDSLKSIETLSSEETMKKFGLSVVTGERSLPKSDTIECKRSMSKVVTIECEHCGKLFKKRRFATHLKRCVKNPLRKPIHYCKCGYKSSDMIKFRHHRNSCVTEPFICDVCGKTINSKSDYLRHKKFQHGIVSKRGTAIKNYPCKDCDRVFYLPSRLKRHWLAQHTDEKNYVCEFCSKSFKMPTALKDHIQCAHFNIYKHYCEKCGHGTNKLAYLRTHVCGKTRRRSKSNEHLMRRLEYNDQPTDLKTFKPKRSETSVRETHSDINETRHLPVSKPSEDSEHGLPSSDNQPMFAGSSVDRFGQSPDQFKHSNLGQSVSQSDSVMLPMPQSYLNLETPNSQSPDQFKHSNLGKSISQSDSVMLPMPLSCLNLQTPNVPTYPYSHIRNLETIPPSAHQMNRFHLNQ